MLAGKKVWVTGHNGMVGSAIVRSLKDNDIELLTISHKNLDLRNKEAVDEWMSMHRPNYIFHVAAKVGGIYANSTLCAESLYDNLMIQTNIIDSAYRFKVDKLLFVATNCVYPKEVSQPISEESILTGRLEENVHYYAIGKIAGIELCRAYRKQYGCDFFSVIPPNLYGPNDNYHPNNSHVIAGIMRRTHEAKITNSNELVVWGDGTARREILYVDDLAEAMKCLMTSELKYDLYNVGQNYDMSIAELAKLIMSVVNYEGKIVYEKTKPNGTMGKLLDSSRIRKLGWYPKVNPTIGLQRMYVDFLQKETK